MTEVFCAYFQIAHDQLNPLLRSVVKWSGTF